ncbi:MAG: cytochrome c biogenesis protein CcsA [Gammaproteobacteria bacterium]|nr:cytochrome c biogenesis protein CcsA [Gammaproteobacteria bacterium]
MNLLTLGLITALLYSAATSALLLRLKNMKSHRNLALLLTSSAVILHAYLLFSGMISADHINLSITYAFSLVSLLVVVLILASSASQSLQHLSLECQSLENPSLENLGIIVFPIAAIASIMAGTNSGEHLIAITSGLPMQTHILLSILAYSLLTVAALQAVVVAIQDHYLRNHHPAGILRILPPLTAMESMLFQLIIVGFVLLSASLMSGVLYLDDIFAQHLVHKTVLSLLAWAVFAILIIGRYKSGWRGKTAIRWTLSGFFLLMLAYFGSKFVLEVILN